MADRPKVPQEDSSGSEPDQTNGSLKPPPDWMRLELAGRDEQLPTIYSVPNHPRLSGVEGVRRVMIFLEDHHKSVSGRLPAFSTARCSAFIQLPKGWLVLGEGDYVFSRDKWGDGQPANDVLRVAVTSKVPKTTTVYPFPHLVPLCILARFPKDCVVMWRSPQIHGSSSPGIMDDDPVLVSLQVQFADLNTHEMPGIVTPEERDVDSGYVSEYS